MTEDINEWVKQRLNAGENPNVLKERLSEYGYDPIILDKITSPAPLTSPENKDSVKKFKQNKFVIVGVITLIIIGIFSLNFINSIFDFHRNQILEDNQYLFIDQLNDGEKSIDDLIEFVRDSITTCKESKNYMFFGHHRDECYVNTHIFYMYQIDDFYREGKISQEEHKQAMSQASNYVLKEICPNIENKKIRGECESIPKY